jgi:D-cysteine desulfhydrase
LARNEVAASRRLLRLVTDLWVAERARPLVLWPGGSSPRGVLGFVEVALEIAAQVRAGAMPTPSYLFVPLASCGTLAGLVLGLRVAQLDTVPVGVRVYDRRIANARSVLALAEASRRMLARFEPSFGRLQLRPSDLLVLHDHAGAGYAEATAEGVHALELARDHAGLVLEETYSAKALAGLGAFMATTERRSRPALFVCTYNSRPLDEYIAAASTESVPSELRRWLDR